MKHLAVAIVIILFLTGASGIKPLFAEARGSISEATANLICISPLDAMAEREILGTATSSILEKYVIIKETNSGKKFLYRAGDYINNEFKIIEAHNEFLILKAPGNNSNIILTQGLSYQGVEFIEAVGLTTFEYSYRLLKQDKEIKDSRFELVDVEENKAFLERDYVNCQPQESRQNTAKPSIDEIFFKQIKTKRISDNIWEVDSQSVTTPVIDNIQEAIAYTAKSIKATGFGKSGLRLAVNSKVCSGELDKSGFLVDTLSAEVKEKAGLANGDIIKTVNGKSVYNVIDLIWLFLEIRNGSSSKVDVEILRNKEPVTLTYIIE